MHSFAELKSLGAELAKADLDDTRSLIEALKGCYGVYGVTGMYPIIRRLLRPQTRSVDQHVCADCERSSRKSHTTFDMLR